MNIIKTETLQLGSTTGPKLRKGIHYLWWSLLLAQMKPFTHTHTSFNNCTSVMRKKILANIITRWLEG